jgi:hypothetical protein
MADIDIVPTRRRTSVWLWVILAVIALLVLFWLLGTQAPPTA